MNNQNLLTWNQIASRPNIYLNLGGKSHCHPHPEYKGYVSVELEPANGDYIIHDITKRFNLPDESVDRIHSEDAIHYLTEEDIVIALQEAYRLLKPGGIFRIGVPDYMNPKDRRYLKEGVDPRYPLHLSLTTAESMSKLIEESPFTKHTIHHYWTDDQFIQNPIDYSLGMIQRTPDNDPRCKRTTPRGMFKNIQTILKKGGKLTETEKKCLHGKPWHITSLVVDIIR